MTSEVLKRKFIREAELRVVSNKSHFWCEKCGRKQVTCSGVLMKSKKQVYVCKQCGDTYKRRECKVNNQTNIERINVSTRDLKKPTVRNKKSNDRRNVYRQNAHGRGLAILRLGELNEGLMENE